MENKRLTISFPLLVPSATNLLNSYTNLKVKLHNFAILLLETGTETVSRSSRFFGHRVGMMNTGFNFKRNSRKLLMGVIPVLIIAILIFVGFLVFHSTGSSSSSSTNNPLQVAAAKKVKNLNKTYNFPLTDDKGKQIGSFKYVIESAEVRDEIIVQGKKATAVPGRTFLIINLKLVNDLKQGLQINSRDYIRLSVNGNTSELLAPDIHNDPVEVQAISTQPTRVGFPINDTDKNLVLFVGEINGSKDKVNLGF